VYVRKVSFDEARQDGAGGVRCRRALNDENVAALLRRAGLD